jgi:hypothetical protein
MGIVTPAFKDLDGEIAIAGWKAVRNKTDTASELTDIEDNLRNEKKMIKGRQLLWVSFQSYQTIVELGALTDICDIIQIQFLGDDKMHPFIHAYKGCMHGFSQPPNEYEWKLIRHFFAEQLRSSKKLKYTMELFDIAKRKKPEPGPEYSFDYLMEKCEHVILEAKKSSNTRRLEGHRAAQHGGEGKGSWRPHAYTPGNTPRSEHARDGSRGSSRGYTPRDRRRTGNTPRTFSGRRVNTNQWGQMTPRSAMAAKGGKSSKGKGRGNPKGDGYDAKGSGKRAKGETQCRNETQYGQCTRTECPFMHIKAGRSPRVPGKGGAQAAPGALGTPDPLGRKRSNTPRSPRGTRKICTHWTQSKCKHMQSPNKCKWKHSNSKGRSPRTGSGRRNLSTSGASRRYSPHGQTRLKAVSAKSRSPSAGRKGTGSGGAACVTTGLIAADESPAILPQESSEQSEI